VIRGSYVDTSKCHSVTTESPDWSKNGLTVISILNIKRRADIKGTHRWHCAVHSRYRTMRHCKGPNLNHMAHTPMVPAPTGDADYMYIVHIFAGPRNIIFRGFFSPFGAKPILLAHYKRDRHVQFSAPIDT
jgi:hypothetical protein